MSTTKADVYLNRPWLKEYPAWVPADLTPPFPNAVAMLTHTATARPRRPPCTISTIRSAMASWTA